MPPFSAVLLAVLERNPWFYSRWSYGYRISDLDGLVLCHHGGANLCLRAFAEAAMTWAYLLGGALALGIFAYLIVALFYPEKF
jgi:K+-transporting ATPase KdpF subunit